MKKNILLILLFVPFLIFAQRKKSRYVSTFEAKSSMLPVYRFANRNINYSLNDLSIPLTNKKINLVLDNSRQNSSFDLMSQMQVRFYCVNASYSMGAGAFDKHILVRLFNLKNGDFTELLKKSSVNHNVAIGVNYLGIRQLFKKVEDEDFRFNASVNYAMSIDFSDRFDMSEYINLFEYQNLPEFVIRNKKSFEQVQTFILSKYSLPNDPFYKGISANVEVGYQRFSFFSNYSYMKNSINSRVSNFYFGAKIILN
jgi:hypothetical protein